MLKLVPPPRSFTAEIGAERSCLLLLALLAMRNREGECRDAQASSSTKKCYCRDRCRKELSDASGYEDQGHGRSTEMCAQA
ncbi:hypothetical protein FRX31_024422, partial [Thalictrum thalictroides]